MTARGSKGARAAAAGIEGTVIAAHGRHYLVAPADGGAMLQCFPRGKRSEVAVGDRVTYERSSADQGVIVRIGERRNLLYRSDQFKSKLFAANLDQLLIVLATEPHFSEDLLGRALIAAEAHELEPLIVLNKIDVEAALPFARKRLAPYRELGYTVIELSAKAAPGAVHPQLDARLKGRATLLLGQSGMGKSTLVNALSPALAARVGEVSTSLHAGRHTTSAAMLYRLDALGVDGWVVDSPGMKQFGLAHVTPDALEQAFVEMRPLLGHCRFRDCRHFREPGCAVRAAVDEGRVAAFRLDLLHALQREAFEMKAFAIALIVIT